MGSRPSFPEIPLGRRADDRRPPKSRAGRSSARPSKGSPDDSLEGDILEVTLVDVHSLALAATRAAAAACTGAVAAALAARAPAAEELDVVRGDVHLAPLGAVLGLPGAVLEASLYQDGVALLLVVGDGLAELAPGGDVEEVDLFVLGADPVDGDAEVADRDTALRKAEFGVPR